MLRFLVVLRSPARNENLYSAFSHTDETLPALEFNRDKNKGLITQVWFADQLECDIETIRDVEEMYSFNCGPANPLHNGRASRSLGSEASMLGSHRHLVRDPPEQQMQPQAVPLTAFNLSAPFGKSQLPRTIVVLKDSLFLQVDHLIHSPCRQASATATYMDHWASGMMVTERRRPSAVRTTLRINGSQSIEVITRDCDICANQLQLTAIQKLNALIISSKAPHGTFSFEHYKPSMSYPELIMMMKSEYDIDARQLQVHHELESLRFVAEQRN